MSLTSHLSSVDSPITQYFTQNFDFTKFLQEENKSLLGSYTIRPKSFDNFPWSDMGHMVEYLLILHMGLPVEYLLPMRFAKEEYSQIFYEMKRKYDGFSARLKQINFDTLTDDLYKLSKIEGVYRSGNYLALNNIHNIKATQVMKADIKTIYELSLSQNELFNNSKNKCRYNPVFDLSNEVGGADADLYMIRPQGNYLIDLKTTVKLVVNQEMLYQLLGYVFLDKSNEHKFVDIGLYLPRQNLISEWKIEDLIRNYSKFNNVEQAKSKFIEVVKGLPNGKKIR